jgi:hypothetical protein
MTGPAPVANLQVWNMPDQRRTFEHLPVFPLGAGVVLPGCAIPLHIFESRYHAMTSDVLEGDGRLALAMLDDEAGIDLRGPAFRPMISLGRIVEHDPLPDDRFLIILEGQARLHVTEELDVETPYRQVNAVQARERLDRPDEADLSRRNINGMLMAMASLGLERVTDLLDRTSSLEDAGQVADLVGWSTFDEPRQKQMLLETLNVYRRIKLVEQRVSELVSRVYGSDPSDDDAPKD